MHYIVKEIEFIQQIESGLSFKSNIGRQKVDVELLKATPKGFTYTFPNIEKNPEMGKALTFPLTRPRLNLKVTYAYLKHLKVDTSTSPVSRQTTIHIHSFQSLSFPTRKASFFKKIIPLSQAVSFINVLTPDHGIALDTRRTIQAYRVMVKKTLYTFLFEKHGERHYLILECCSQLSFRAFDEGCWAILISLGYLTGYLVQNEAYHFCYNSPLLKHWVGFQYQSLRDSINIIYHPLNANPYAWIRMRKEKKLADTWYNKLQEFTPELFSKLCTLVRQEYDIQSILLLIVEAMNRTLLLMPAGLSVALEGLTEYVVTEKESAVKPIPDKKQAQQFIQALLQVAGKYAPEIPGFNEIIIRKKIENLNSPTTTEKLTLPFKLVGIALSELDEEVILYRNDFLHGNINLKPRKGKKKYSMDSYEISLRMLTLINSLVLKLVGYDGHILNQVKLQEKGLGKKIDESYYKLI